MLGATLCLEVVVLGCLILLLLWTFTALLTTVDLLNSVCVNDPGVKYCFL